MEQSSHNTKCLTQLPTIPKQKLVDIKKGSIYAKIRKIQVQDDGVQVHECDSIQPDAHHAEAAASIGIPNKERRSSPNIKLSSRRWKSVRS